MQIEAIYDHGRVEFLQPVRLNHERFRIKIELPDEEIALLGAATIEPESEQKVECFSEESQRMLSSLRAIRDSLRTELVKSDAGMSEEECERQRAFALRARSRQEQGRPE